MKKTIVFFCFVSLFLSACYPSQGLSQSEERDFLVDKYLEYSDIYNNLFNSAGSGADVERAYSECQNIISEIADAPMSEKNQDLAATLMTGLLKQCTGFGCLSNKSLCQGENEAFGLIYQGKQLLDQFYENIQ